MTTIEWANYTFNPFSGCTKVSPACAHCYAADLPPAMRRGAKWGPHEPRIPATAAYWQQPLAWERKAVREGRRFRVFCGSTFDLFEGDIITGGYRKGQESDLDVRPDYKRMLHRLFNLIVVTPHLDWQLLTKRPWNAYHWWRRQEESARERGAEAWWPPNAWIGATVENQEWADRRIPWLLRIPADVRFLSCEPLLGPIDLKVYLADTSEDLADEPFDRLPQEDAEMARGLQWVIAGGESGLQARPSHPDWFRALRDQCKNEGTPFFFKQWGEWAPWLNEEHFTHGGKEQHPHAWIDSDSGESGHAWIVDDDGLWSNWTGAPPRGQDGRSVAATVSVLGRLGKKNAGRLLDGVEWSQFPAFP